MTAAHPKNPSNDRTGGVAFVGLGAMGSAIAGRLLHDDGLLVYDLNPGAADGLIARGATFASPATIAESCEFVFTCLPTPADVVEFLLGRDGLAYRLRPGSVVVDMTTGTPTVDGEIAESLRAHRIEYADVPISGGPRRTTDGTAALMAGASGEVFHRIADLLRLVTPNVFHVGGVGAGHTMKLVNNFLNNCNRFAALEAVRLGEINGIARDVIIDVLNNSTGRNHVTEVTYPQYLSGEQYRPQGFTLNLMFKDIALANELARAVGHDTPIGEVVEKLTGEAVARFGAHADQSKLMAEWHGHN